MKKRYRIAKTTIRDGKGEIIDTKYKIQKKFLWWWVTAPTETCREYHSGSKAMEIDYNQYFTFNSREKCKQHLYTYHLNRYVEKYKGKTIKRYLGKDGKSVYINYSNGFFRYYQHSDSIEGIKNIIDGNIKKITNSFEEINK